MQNNLRGIYCEYMVADALGPACNIVSHSWNAWDLELGDQAGAFPDRIRLQVKNTARLQPWQIGTLERTRCQWSLPQRRRPAYFSSYNPGIQCEEYGFLCDAFVLCHHPETDENLVDQSDPAQWWFYVVPVTAETSPYALYQPASDAKARTRSYTVVPESLRKGIRGRPPVEPVQFAGLTEQHVRQRLKLGASRD